MVVEKSGEPDLDGLAGDCFPNGLGKFFFGDRSLIVHANKACHRSLAFDPPAVDACGCAAGKRFVCHVGHDDLAVDGVVFDRLVF